MLRNKLVVTCRVIGFPKKKKRDWLRYGCMLVLKIYVGLCLIVRERMVFILLINRYYQRVKATKVNQLTRAPELLTIAEN